VGEGSGVARVTLLDVSCRWLVMGKGQKSKRRSAETAGANLTPDTLYFGSIFYNINAFDRNRDEF